MPNNQLSLELNRFSKNFVPIFALGGQFERLCSLVKHIPVQIASGLIETHIKTVKPQIDLSVEVAGIKDFYKSKWPSTTSWQQVRNILEDYSKKGTILNKQVSDIWLEFDLIEDFVEVPDPGIFVRLKQDPFFNTEKDILEVAKKLCGNHYSTEIEKAIGLCFRSLPLNSRIGYLGMMFSRSAESIRINVVNIKPDDCINYLKKYTSDIHEDSVKKILSITKKYSDFTITTFDAMADSIKNPGFECYLNSATRTKWYDFLAPLEELSLLSKEESLAILNWRGISRVSPDSHSLSNTKFMDQLMGAAAANVFWRKINHLKLKPDNKGDIGLKVYKSFGNKWIPRPDILTGV